MDVVKTSGLFQVQLALRFLNVVVWPRFTPPTSSIRWVRYAQTRNDPKVQREHVIDHVRRTITASRKISDDQQSCFGGRWFHLRYS